MIDRSKYPAKFAPPADELIERWNKNTPTAREIESIFLNELCESAEHDYFLAVSDVFFDAVSNQDEEEQHKGLCAMGFRLLEAASHATTADEALADHFHLTLKKFAKLFYQRAQFEKPSKDNRLIQTCRLAIHAALAGDLTLAFLIYRPSEELKCPNPECDETDYVTCPSCDAYIDAYSHFELNYKV